MISMWHAVVGSDGCVRLCHAHGRSGPLHSEPSCWGSFLVLLCPAPHAALHRPPTCHNPILLPPLCCLSGLVLPPYAIRRPTGRVGATRDHLAVRPPAFAASFAVLLLLVQTERGRLTQPEGVRRVPAPGPHHKSTRGVRSLPSCLLSSTVR
jgi:hypothetical protein